MADFQSSKTAQEIEQVLTGALLYNVAQALTEGEKAFVREKIGATAQGEGIKIISHFDSLEELKAAVPNPSAGDAYSIGDAMPYNLYIYDFYHDSWVNHGPIRANDISARFAQNMVVATSAWEEDTNVFPDYSYKAAIPLAEITGDDFPIVAFSPSDAVGGNFCPICFAFDGYIEIWARFVPDADITVPAITFILQETEGAESGNSTKGITNAGGGFPEGGVTNAMLASNSVGTSKMMNGSVTRAKLAQDALYSPMKYVSTTACTFAVEDIGKTYMESSSVATTADVVYTVDDTFGQDAPNGAEIAIIWRRAASVKIAFTGNQGSMMLGSTGALKNQTYTITDQFGMVALKKINYGTTCWWLVTGNVEVVS